MAGSQQTTEGRVTWRYRKASVPPFAKELFQQITASTSGVIAGDSKQTDIHWEVDGTAMAGRGNALFVNVDSVPLVLRRYLRGGIVQRFSEESYLWLGLERTRAMREFELLLELEIANLPVMRAYAVEVVRQTYRYRACFLSYRAPGKTLAEWLLAMQAGRTVDFAAAWPAIGYAIADLHQFGVWHADLNAHNILVHDGQAEVLNDNVQLTNADQLSSDCQVTLIDFDRARRRGHEGQRKNLDSRWAKQNLKRLARSINKITDGALASPAVASESATPTEQHLSSLYSLKFGWESLYMAYQQRRQTS